MTALLHGRTMDKTEEAAITAYYQGLRQYQGQVDPARYSGGTKKQRLSLNPSTTDFNQKWEAAQKGTNMAALNQEQAATQSRRLMALGIPHMVRNRSWSKAFYAIMVPEPARATQTPPADLVERLGTEDEVAAYLSRVEAERRPIDVSARFVGIANTTGEENHIFLIDNLPGENPFAYITRTANGLGMRPRGMSGNGRFSLAEIRERHGILNGPDGRRYRVNTPMNMFNYER
jgi:hypothetical protein